MVHQKQRREADEVAKQHKFTLVVTPGKGAGSSPAGDEKKAHRRTLESTPVHPRIERTKLVIT